MKWLVWLQKKFRVRDKNIECNCHCYHEMAGFSAKTSPTKEILNIRPNHLNEFSILPCIGWSDFKDNSCRRIVFVLKLQRLDNEELPKLDRLNRCDYHLELQEWLRKKL
ncbi:hypothetical protein AVEN_257985-1 [Araneus ventricosus]|uniref:Uncharacterized protein n=1 Tax=Araneus ventricosus TaxID=182803 RepID=A0A4Y2K9R7_ARAVE|nr:hypothetical protein AVEN_257985-1 [Araneus ventricosus]